MNAWLDDNNSNDCSSGLRFVVNIIGLTLISNKSEETYIYNIGVRADVLWGFYSINQFDLCEQKLYDLADIATDIEVTHKNVVQEQPIFDGQVNVVHLTNSNV